MSITQFAMCTTELVNAILMDMWRTIARTVCPVEYQIHFLSDLKTKIVYKMNSWFTTGQTVSDPCVSATTCLISISNSECVGKPIKTCECLKGYIYWNATDCMQGSLSIYYIVVRCWHQSFIHLPVFSEISQLFVQFCNRVSNDDPECGMYRPFKEGICMYVYHWNHWIQCDCLLISWVVQIQTPCWTFKVMSSLWNSIRIYYSKNTRSRLSERLGMFIEFTQSCLPGKWYLRMCHWIFLEFHC
jgi:hypothetical protein